VVGLIVWAVIAVRTSWNKNYANTDEQALQTEVNKIVPEQLPGMPPELDGGYRAVAGRGPAALRNWLRMYGQSVQDPRRAWIELDYMVAISKEDPSEARRIFADVKGRTPEDSPIYPRIKQLQKTYE
jgi:hypothetical protein